MIKNSGGKFDDYWISPKVTQILLHWGCELKKQICYNFFSLRFLHFLLHKSWATINSTKRKYYKKQRKNFLKKKLLSIIYWTKKQLNKRQNRYKNMTDKEKQAKKEYQKNYYNKLKAYKDELLLEKVKRDKKKVVNYYKKKRNKCKNMSKIKIKTIYKQFKWL